MESSLLTAGSLLVNSLGTIIIGISAVLLWKQIREGHDWNRRKTSQEILGNLTIGEFPALREKIEVDFGCQIWNNQETYATKVAALSEQELLRLNHVVIRVLNILESISVHMKNHIIDEDICYDYLGWILIKYVRWADPLIEDRRSKAQDLRIFKSVKDYAEKWSARFKAEQKAMTDRAVVPGKRRLGGGPGAGRRSGVNR